jgi:hypothetical protein
LQGGKSRGEFCKESGRFLLRACGVEGKCDGEADVPSLENAKFVGKACDEGGVFFWVENGERMFAEGENSRGGGDVGSSATQNHSLMTKVKTVKEAEGKMAEIRTSRGRRKRFG